MGLGLKNYGAWLYTKVESLLINTWLQPGIHSRLFGAVAALRLGSLISLHDPRLAPWATDLSPLCGWNL
jgi:hypothetical protein